MLWLCLHFPRLPAEALGLRDPLDVVTEQRGAQRWLITASDTLAAGTPLGLALSLVPDLRAHPRRAVAEQAMLQQLAQNLYRYGSPVCCEIRAFDEAGRAPQALLWIEIAASLHLFGGYSSLRTAIQSDLHELEHRVQLAIAPTRAASALFALHRLDGIDTDASLDAALAALPIAMLPWPTATLEALHGVGLRQISELLALPRTAFARRFGPAMLRELDRLRGRAAEPAATVVPPTLFRRRFELAGEVETIEALSFALRRLALELQHWLRSRDAGVRALRLSCEHAQRRRSSFTLRYGDTHRDGKRIFDTLRERLGREPLAGAVRALRLEALETGTAEVAQADLFDQSGDGNDWRAAIERLAARLGDGAVWTPLPCADHRPERALARGASNSDSDIAPISSPRPLWLLRQPQAIPAPSPPPHVAERIESGWWDGAEVQRDYYCIETAQARAWVFHDPRRDRWFLHGLWG